jgi:hypothetical protein
MHMQIHMHMHMYMKTYMYGKVIVVDHAYMWSNLVLWQS